MQKVERQKRERREWPAQEWKQQKQEIVFHRAKENHLLQIVVEGSLSIYFIRDDGSSYALAISQKDAMIGEMEFFGESRIDGIFAEVTQKLICLAFFTAANRSVLLKDAGLLPAIAESLIDTIKTITMQNAAPPSLRERACSYMLYKCEGRQLNGVEKAAFQLHCSPRQLQRVLNAFVQDGIAKKIGKGAYELFLQARRKDHARC